MDLSVEEEFGMHAYALQSISFEWKWHEPSCWRCTFE